MDYAEKDFGKIIKKNAQAQRHDLLPRKINCMRIYDRNLDAYPVTVDLYDKYAKVVDFGEEPMSNERLYSCMDMIHRMAYIDEDKIVYSYRAKRENRQQFDKSDESLRTTVMENGHSFIVDLKKYTDTGLFLDHEEARALIEEKSAGCDVLNLFSYTGSFSVYAACGGAKSVTSVDLSATYTKWAVENLEHNGFSGQQYQCVCMDAGKFIEQAKEKHDCYDIIIFDPPSFSNSRKMEGDFDVGKDYVNWIKNLTGILRAKGFILFSNNLSGFRMDKRRLRGLDVREITGQLLAPGFVKNRKGTVRSWIMANDDNSLTLDWSEEPKKEKKEKYERHESKEYPKKEYGKREYVKKEYGKKEYGKREYKPKTDHREFRGERREYSRDTDRMNRFDRPSRDFHKEERADRYNRYEKSDRYDRFDRSDRSDRYERSERYHSSERYSDRPRERRTRPDRFERFDHSERRSNDKPRREKPYGYDSFKPARSRNDNSDFFWNKEDL